ncbi:MAG TPA: hypothetical protein VM598_11765, partial [Bdellovibrionota bacterium]|nr:hypothetical protein [Bdellovibrionota bacterium]
MALPALAEERIPAIKDFKVVRESGCGQPDPDTGTCTQADKTTVSFVVESGSRCHKYRLSQETMPLITMWPAQQPETRVTVVDEGATCRIGDRQDYPVTLVIENGGTL